MSIFCLFLSFGGKEEKCNLISLNNMEFVGYHVIFYCTRRLLYLTPYIEMYIDIHFSSYLIIISNVFLYFISVEIRD